MKLGAVAALAALCSVASAATIASSTFSANSENWKVLTSDTTTSGYPVQIAAFSPTYNSSGGNPGGYISILDPDSNDTFFQAPSAFTGNLSSALFGILRFDTLSDSPPDYTQPTSPTSSEVVIKGGGLTLVYEIPQPAQQGIWTTVTASLAPSSNWHTGTATGSLATLADFQTAFANVTNLWITGETHFGVTETVGLDNVLLSSSVPEPSTVLFVCVGLAAGALFRRRA